MDNNPEILGVKNLCASCLRHTNVRIPVNAPDRKKRAFRQSYAKSDGLRRVCDIGHAKWIKRDGVRNVFADHLLINADAFLYLPRGRRIETGQMPALMDAQQHGRHHVEARLIGICPLTRIGPDGELGGNNSCG